MNNDHFQFSTTVTCPVCEGFTCIKPHAILSAPLHDRYLFHHFIGEKAQRHYNSALKVPELVRKGWDLNSVVATDVGPFTHSSKPGLLMAQLHRALAPPKARGTTGDCRLERLEWLER